MPFARELDVKFSLKPTLFQELNWFTLKLVPNLQVECELVSRSPSYADADACAAVIYKTDAGCSLLSHALASPCHSIS